MHIYIRDTKLLFLFYLKDNRYINVLVEFDIIVILT